jgi:hypothetical protein
MNSHFFAGRGKGTDHHVEPYRLIECADRMVLAIIFASHGVEFIQGYCRKALIDKWGLQCIDPFLRGGDSTLTRAWAIPLKRRLFLFRATRLDLVAEQEWMRVTEG